jgi:xylulokinase
VDMRRLAALCITPQRETFVPVDQTGQPLRNAILWMDERARPLLPWIEGAIGRERFHQITGKPLSGNLSVAKIAWLRQHEPQVFSDTARFLDVTAYLHHKLIGEYVTGWGCADPMGLFDMRLATWSNEILALCGVHPGQFPIAFPPGEVIGALTSSAANVTGMPGGLPVVAGVGDGQAAGLGSGIIEPGWAYLSLGTSAITGICKPVYQVDTAFRTLYYPLPGTYTLETALLSGTYLVDWFVETFLSKAEEAENRVLTLKCYRKPPWKMSLERSVVLVPYWNSAMSPYWDPAAAVLWSVGALSPA